MLRASSVLADEWDSVEHETAPECPEWWPEVIAKAERLWPTPKRPPNRPGQIDFFRIHAFALDRLDELLELLLPEGHEGATEAGVWAWIGRHPDRPVTIAVCLLTGAWDEPATGRGGRDLISLVAHIGGQGQRQAASFLATWCGIEERRYA